ncbi:MAG: tyrosine-type recombinase/integrase [Nitrospiraceae bacterium]
MKQRGLGGVYKRGNVWWVYYSFRGKPYRESSNSTRHSDAMKLLKRRHAEMGRGQLVGPDMDKTTFENLATIIEQDYLANQRRSLKRMKTSLSALREFFGPSYARDITLDRLNAYVAARLEDGIMPASIRNDLAIMKRAFRLAARAGKAIVPPFPVLDVRNTRTGFFEREDFEAIRAHLPESLQGVVTVGYCTGWRIRSEVLTLQWKQIDWTAGIIRLEPNTTKNSEGRTFPFTILPELAETLKRQWEHTKALQRATGRLIGLVFHRNGRPIKDYRGAWEAACKAAKIVGRIPHDFRRTAVRNLERANVSRSVAMKLTGHLTESVYKRYAIVSESDLAEGLKRLATLHDRDAKAVEESRTVTVLAQ